MSDDARRSVPTIQELLAGDPVVRTFYMYAPTVTLTNKAATTKAKPLRRPRKPSLTTVATQAAKAGLEVARYEVNPDGKITVVTGKVEPEPTNDLDKWMAKRHAN